MLPRVDCEAIGRAEERACPTHDSSKLHFTQVTAPDVVNEVPVFGTGMHPRILVHVTELEESVCDCKTQFRADREQPEPATIHDANFMMTKDAMTYVVISANPGIEIAQRYYFAAMRIPSEGGIQRVIKRFFTSSVESIVGEWTLTKVTKRLFASGSRNIMSRSSTTMGDSWVHRKFAVINANPTQQMRRATFGRPLQKNV